MDTPRVLNVSFNYTSIEPGARPTMGEVGVYLDRVTIEDARNLQALWMDNSIRTQSAPELFMDQSGNIAVQWQFRLTEAEYLAIHGLVTAFAQAHLGITPSTMAKIRATEAMDYAIDSAKAKMSGSGRSDDH